MPDPQNEPIAQAKLHWYRIPLDRAVLAELNQRSDAWGFAQTHGTVYAFLLNAFHELCHTTVFKTRSLNRFFLYLVSFIGDSTTSLSGRAIKSITNTHFTSQTRWKSFCQ